MGLKRRRVECTHGESPDHRRTGPSSGFESCTAEPVSPPKRRRRTPSPARVSTEQCAAGPSLQKRVRLTRKVSVVLVASQSERPVETAYFDLLGVSRCASMDDIRRAYRRRAMVTHPDRGGDTGAFQRVLDAYEKLSDPCTREAYEMYCDSSGSMDGKTVQAANTRQTDRVDETSRHVVEAANLVAREHLLAVRFGGAATSVDSLTPLQLLSLKKLAQGGIVFDADEDLTRCEKEQSSTFKGKVSVCGRKQGNLHTYEVSARIGDLEVYSHKTTSLGLVLDAQIALGRLKDQVSTEDDLSQEVLKELCTSVPSMVFHFRFRIFNSWSPSSDNVGLLLRLRSELKAKCVEHRSSMMDRKQSWLEDAKAAIAKDKLMWLKQRKDIVSLIGACFHRRVRDTEMKHRADERRIAKREFDCGRRELESETGRRLQAALRLDSVVATATVLALQRLPAEELARRAASLVAPYSRPALRDRRAPSSRACSRSPAPRRPTQNRKSRCLPITWPLAKPDFGCAPWMDYWPKEVARKPMSCLSLEELARFQMCSPATLVVGRNEFLARCRTFVYLPGSPLTGRTRSGRSVKVPVGSAVGWRKTARLLSQPRFASTFKSLDLSLLPPDAFDAGLCNALSRMSSLTHVVLPSHGWRCPNDKTKAVASLPEAAVISFVRDGAVTHTVQTTTH